MKFAFAILACFCIAQFQIASSILCFTCVYEEGDANSKLCESNPSQVDLKEYRNAKTETEDVSTKALKYFCVTIKANVENGTESKKYVKRYAHQMESFAGSQFCDVKVPPNSGAPPLVNVNTCYCNKDKCNTDEANVGTGDSGANTIHTSIFLLVLGLFTFIYKHAR